MFMTHPFLANAQQHLSADPIMQRLIQQHTAPAWRDQTDLLLDLVDSIIGQQLSVKVGDVLMRRFMLLLPQGIDPEAILKIDDEAIRGCGISSAKIRAIKGAAAARLEGGLDPEKFAQMSDEEAVNNLIQLRGVGPWTAQMLLIFSMQRPDVFSVGDLGLRNAVKKLYGIDPKDLPAIALYAQRWAPYRSIAARYLWKSLDNESVAIDRDHHRD
jgi:DNA-3-methyladenine glycosylase II